MIATRLVQFALLAGIAWVCFQAFGAPVWLRLAGAWFCALFALTLWVLRTPIREDRQRWRDLDRADTAARVAHEALGKSVRRWE